MWSTFTTYQISVLKALVKIMIWCFPFFRISHIHRSYLLLDGFTKAYLGAVVLITLAGSGHVTWLQYVFAKSLEVAVFLGIVQ